MLLSPQRLNERYYLLSLGSAYIVFQQTDDLLSTPQDVAFPTFPAAFLPKPWKILRSVRFCVSLVSQTIRKPLDLQD